MKNLFALLIAGSMLSIVASGCAHKKPAPVAAPAPAMAPAPAEPALTPPPPQ